MVSNNLFVLEALDTADTQWFHGKVVMIAGMGVFTAAYDLFSIVTVSKLLGRLYYPDHANREPGILPFNIGSALVGVALVGTLTGQLVFGWLGDKLGRKKVYGITLLLMTLCAICSGLSFGYSLRAVIGTLCFFRFWLGLGIGGAYTLSAIIMSEHANKRTRGSFIAAVFAMQGVGVFFCSIVSMIVSHLFLKANPAPPFQFDHVRSTQPNADYAWRIVFMLGAFPALLTYFLLIKMPETARYTAVIEGNTKQAGAYMGLVSDIEIQAEEEKLAMFNSNNDYPLLSRKFFERHGLHLIGTMSTCFFLNIAFYSQTLIQMYLFPGMGLTHKSETLNALEEMFDISSAVSIINLLSTIPDYWFTVAFIDKLGRLYIQLMGFFMMSMFMLIMGIKYEDLATRENRWLFSSLYGLTFFFANFGPKTTTYVLAAELFPTRVRSTCHAITAASGKVGAIISSFVVYKYTMTLDKHKIKTALMTLAVTNMLGFFCTFLLTETKGLSLEEISGENGSEDKAEVQENI